MATHMRADPDAKALAEKMVMAEQTMHEILDETVTSAENGEVLESGRTACGSITSARNPVNRFPESVDLQSCPRGVSGTWHSHVRQSELLDPEHSLPDMANVVFGAVDCSVVTGARSSDVLMAAADRGEMQRSFRNVLGLDVQSPGDVVEAIESREITDYGDVRSRVRAEFSSLFRTVDMPFGVMEQRVRQLADDGIISPHSPGERAGAYLEPMYTDDMTVQSGGQWRTEKVRQRVRTNRENLAEVSTTVAETAVGSVVAVATKRAVRSVF